MEVESFSIVCCVMCFHPAPVWKVARCTSAAPMFFSEFEDHVDGGVLANNPCQVGAYFCMTLYKLLLKVLCCVNDKNECKLINNRKILYIHE